MCSLKSSVKSMRETDRVVFTLQQEGVPALTVEQKPEGLEMLRSRAKELKVSLPHF